MAAQTLCRLAIYEPASWLDGFRHTFRTYLFIVGLLINWTDPVLRWREASDQTFPTRCSLLSEGARPRLYVVGFILSIGSTNHEEHVKIFGPDVVIVDIVLPDEDGYSFVKKLRMSNDAAIRNIPAIALTTLVSEEFRERALAKGFQLYLGKPIPAPEIVTHIMNLLGPADSMEFRRTG